MMKQVRSRSCLSEVQRELASWRARHGGRGRSLPANLWTAATEVAAVEGLESTARALGVSRARLARRLQERSAAVVARSAMPVAAAFVEVDAQRVFAPGRSVIRLRGVTGEQMEVEVEGGAMDVASVARSLWECAR